MTGAPQPARVRILVAGDWEEWQATRSTCAAFTARMALQRVSRPDIPHSVGIGYAEAVRRFAPIDTAHRRELVIAYAAAVLQHEGFPTPAPELRALSIATASTGIVLLSHAETDLLALERARVLLPPDFPPVAGYSLNGLTSESLAVRVGSGRKLFVIARLHGAVESVPGLLQLIVQAQEEGWSLATVSGVGAGLDDATRTSDVSAELVSNLTAYFLAGGAHNVAQAMRYVAHEHLDTAVSFEPVQAMPAHGLYHPDLLVTTDDEWNEHRDAGKPVAAVLFYRAHVLSGNLSFVDQLIRGLQHRGCAAIGIFTSSLREVSETGLPLALSLLAVPPEVVVNTVSYPIVTRSSLQPGPAEGRALESLGAPWLQAICCGTTREIWSASPQGLSPVEAAMNVALPECDGRVIAPPVSFKESHRYVPDPERVGRVADLARRLASLRSKRNDEKKIAVILSSSAGKAQRVGGAIGLDTPASLVRFLDALRSEGYEVGALPESPDGLMGELLAAGSYDERHPLSPATPCRMSRRRYLEWFLAQSPGFQKSVRDLWGAPSIDGPAVAAAFWRGEALRTRPAFEPHSDRDSYLFCGLPLGNVLLAVQPPRSFGVDPEIAYHAPDLPPCHHYVAFYRWLADVWGADALIHFGAHGTLEWLPGKSLALSPDCAPDVLLGDLPLFYPFVVNNPGEGSQAKRRTHAVIVGHLVPPLTHAGSHGALASLARLVEEYYRTEVLDPGKLPLLRRQIWDLVCEAELAADLRELRRERHGNHEHFWDDRLTAEGAPRALERLSAAGFAHLVEDLDTYLCDLGRAQIRGGLHIFGEPPAGEALLDLLFAILSGANGAVQSLPDTVAQACGIQPAALRECRGIWPGPVPAELRLEAHATSGQIRAAIDELARRLLRDLARQGFAVEAVDGLFPGAEEPLRFACETLVPSLARSTDETRNLLNGLEGRHVPAGPAGAPSRGMAHVLPTGRNFYTFDPRGLPTRAAWTIGRELANRVVARHLEDAQRWPESIAMSLWGAPTLRTGGDEIAQALALIGVRPVWDSETHRAVGVEIVPLSELGRPRIDVTLRVSGFFRDALAVLMASLDDAISRVALLDEPVEQNFVRKHWLADRDALIARGLDADAAQRRASYRVFGPGPGAYGTGLLQLMEEKTWTDARDLAGVAVSAGGWAYGGGAAVAAKDELRVLLARVDVVVQCHDNREQDLFDSTDYFEFNGGLAAAVTAQSGRRPSLYCADSSEPSRPQVRTLQLEALRVYRSRVVNPKWLSAMRRHGYRGGLEMAATVEGLFGYSATVGIITDWMFEGVAAAFTDAQSREFLARSNPWALNAIAERLLEAEQRGMWRPTPERSAALRNLLLESEAALEGEAALQGSAARSAGYS